jgi:aminopeptidase N
MVPLVDVAGREGFRKGTDLYFDRHDGQAVTCDDFRAAIADANGQADGLAQFERWYTTAGTPHVVATPCYDEAANTYTITLVQSVAVRNNLSVGVAAPFGCHIVGSQPACQHQHLGT